MITLSQAESNLVLFVKGHYKDIDEDFWKSIEILYNEHYNMTEFNILGCYNMVRRIWRQLATCTLNLEQFLNEYDELTLPMSNWKVYGGIRRAKTLFEREPPFSDEDCIRARIAVMCSQIRHTQASFFQFMPITAVGELKPKP
jgi:hypothetical protein